MARSGLQIDRSSSGYGGTYVEHFLPVRRLGAASGQANTSGETPSKGDLSWRRVVLDS